MGWLWNRWTAGISACCVALAGISAAQTTDDLPSAPSAVIQKNSPPPAPGPQGKPAEPAPEVPSTATPKAEEPPASDQKASVTPPPDDSSGIASGRPTITKEVNVVSVVLTVTDKHNRYVKDLKEGDFKVVDDEKPVENLRVHHESDLPLQVGLLIDASGSIRERFKF